VPLLLAFALVAVDHTRVSDTSGRLVFFAV
jgi:hypothetical protein